MSRGPGVHLSLSFTNNLPYFSPLYYASTSLLSFLHFSHQVASIQMFFSSPSIPPFVLCLLPVSCLSSTYDLPTASSSRSPPTSHPLPLFLHKGSGNPISQMCGGGHAWRWLAPTPRRQERECRRQDTLFSRSMNSGVVLNAGLC